MIFDIILWMYYRTCKESADYPKCESKKKSISNNNGNWAWFVSWKPFWESE